MPKKKGRRGLVEVLRDAIRNSGQSLNQISKTTGVGSNQLSRFMRGERTLTLPVAEKLCDTLGLQLSKVRRQRAEPAEPTESPEPPADTPEPQPEPPAGGKGRRKGKAREEE